MRSTFTCRGTELNLKRSQFVFLVFVFPASFKLGHYFVPPMRKMLYGATKISY